MCPMCTISLTVACLLGVDDRLVVVGGAGVGKVGVSICR